MQCEELVFSSENLAITEYPMLRTAEKKSVNGDRAIGIHLLFEAQVKKTPEAIAVIFDDQTLTYQELNQRANQLAHHLIQQGVGPEVLVGICVERSLDMIVGLLGILKAGGAYVPLDPDYPADRLAFILADTQVPVILTQARFIEHLPAHSARILCLDADWSKISRNRSDDPIGRSTADHLMYVIYTSGSTGKPKGVMIPHAGIWNQLYWRQTTFPLTQTDRVLQSISFSFDPSVWQIFWPLSFGAQLVLPVPNEQKDIPALVRLMAQQQVTIMALVPSMLRVLLEQPELDQCTHLKHVFCGGEALPTELIEQFFQRFSARTFLHNVYGPTEASIDATFWTCQPDTPHRIAPIGQAITNAQIHILDENLNPVAMGEAGELHISGAGLARGYLNRPELTAEKFILNPDRHASHPRLYKTGDLGRCLPDGNIEFLGRIDHQVKIRGFRIELGEIEAVLNQHPLLAETVVIAREDSPGNHRLVAYVVPDAGKQPIVLELRNFLLARLPEYMVPAAFIVLESFPLNANGKLDRHALPMPQAEHFNLERRFEAPRDALERELAQIWEQILNICPIGIKDNFFELGGDSLLAVRLLSQVEIARGQKLPLTIFQEAATIEKLAECIRQQNWAPVQESLVEIQPHGTKRPLFCIHSRTRNVLNYFPLARYLPADQPIYGLQPRTADVDLLSRLSIEEMAADYIAEIKTIQPIGPYSLLGYSFGGLIAYEMARQLLEQGEHVALLALADTYNSQQPWFKPVPAYLHFFRRLGVHRNELSQRNWQEKLRYIWKVLNRSTDATSNEPASLQRQPSNPDTGALEAAFLQIMQKYTPRSYPGRIILFRATRPPEEYFGLISVKIDPLLGWSALANRIEVYALPCDHFNIIFEPSIRYLAEGLQKYLDLTQANSKL